MSVRRTNQDTPSNQRNREAERAPEREEYAKRKIIAAHIFARAATTDYDDYDVSFNCVWRFVSLFHCCCCRCLFAFVSVSTNRPRPSIGIYTVIHYFYFVRMRMYTPIAVCRIIFLFFLSISFGHRAEQRPFVSETLTTQQTKFTHHIEPIPSRLFSGTQYSNAPQLLWGYTPNIQLACVHHSLCKCAVRKLRLPLNITEHFSERCILRNRLPLAIANKLRILSTETYDFAQELLIGHTNFRICGSYIRRQRKLYSVHCAHAPPTKLSIFKY